MVSLSKQATPPSHHKRSVPEPVLVPIQRIPPIINAFSRGSMKAPCRESYSRTRCLHNMCAALGCCTLCMSSARLHPPALITPAAEYVEELPISATKITDFDVIWFDFRHSIKDVQQIHFSSWIDILPPRRDGFAGILIVCNDRVFARAWKLRHKTATQTPEQFDIPIKPYSERFGIRFFAHRTRTGHRVVVHHHNLAVLTP